ncbi:MAG TPA: hypothetical protein VIH67_10835 [Candidatus Acidoferrum sp.]
MLTPQQVLRITIELLFVLLGGLVVWLGLTGHILFDRRKPGWLLLSVAVILWGLRALYKPVQWWSRTEQWTRGLSLAVLGVVMLAISRVPFLWVGPLLAFVGVLLIVRGLIGFALIFRPR